MRSNTFAFTLAVGMFSAGFGVWLFERTIIDVKTPVSVALAVGLIGFVIAQKHFRKTARIVGKKAYVYAFIGLLIGFGGVGFFSFLALNYFGADKSVVERTFPITSKSSISRLQGDQSRKRLTVTINYEGLEKRFTFTHEDFLLKDEFNYVGMKTSKGFLGYDIILDRQLL